MEILFNNSGIPLMAFGNKALVSTFGVPSSSAATPPNDEPESFDGIRIYPWGPGNCFPDNAEAIIRKSTVLNSGLKYKMQTIMGQGIFPTRVTGYKDDGQEILQVIDDTELQKLLRSRKIRRYLSMGTRDLLKFGNTFPEFIFNAEGNRILGINVINARHCRWVEMKDGIITALIVYGNWKEGTPSSKKQYKKILVLDNFDPLSHLNELRRGEKLKGTSVIFPIKEIFSNNDNLYYPVVDKDKYLKGIITIDHLKKTFMLSGLNEFLMAFDLMEPVIAVIHPDTSMTEARDEMARNQMECLPVVTKDNKLVGFIESRSIQRLISQKIAELERKSMNLEAY